MATGIIAELKDGPGTFAWRVARLRGLVGLGVDEFAALLGVEPGQVEAWEDGTSDPGPKRRELVMGALAGADPAALAAAMPATATLH